MPRAALYDRTGGPEVLYVGEVDDAQPGSGQLAVRVHAAGLNPFDGKLRSGFIPSEAPFPRRTGGDFAGTVEAVGEGAVFWDGTPIAVGDEVMGRAGGAVAERVIASAREVARRPDAVPVEVAGALWVAGLTAVSCLVTVPVGAGDTLLVGGAAGGVGLVVSQLARDAGARVIGTASPRNHDLLRSLGIEPTAYGEGLAERVATLASGEKPTGRVAAPASAQGPTERVAAPASAQGSTERVAAPASAQGSTERVAAPASAQGRVTAVVDCHGRDALDAGIALGVPVDRMAAIAAYAAGAELGVQNAEREARTPENLAGLADRIAAGTLVLPVAASFPLDEVAAAFTALESSHAPGKVVILP
ncbi:NADP-dependent oxidoreductase [Microbacterium sp.]|uniref:NADP-dependent oxidoreductase n=1 Tax=Microbacterium sp. TaxID=51671 RepID=UPI0039E3E022